MNIRHSKLASSCDSTGFSMIDVLVAIVVLAVAMLALAALQGTLTRNTADARARSQIATFAEGALDQMRSSGYATIATGTVLPSNTGTTLQKAAYSAQAAAGITNLKAVFTVDTYATTTPTSGVFAKTALTVPAGTATYKQVNAVTTWTDATGQPRTLTFDTIVSPVTVDTSNNTLVGKQLTPSASQTPIVREFNPGAGPGVIPIAVGVGTDTAATNPKPELLGRTNNLLVGTSFNVLTYQAPDAANQSVIQQRVENRVIRCSCKNGAGITDATNVFAQPFRPTYWNATRYVTPTATTAKTTTVGADPTATQDQFCDICCRDRNDTAADTVKFDPFTSDYKHYRYDSTDTLVSVGPSDSNAYLNACRLIRVDGMYSVATDLQNYFFGLLATSNQSTPATAAKSAIPDPTYVTSYQGFVTNYLTQSITPLAAGTGPVSTATAASMYASASLDNPTNISINYAASPPIDYRYLHARGLYIDHLEAPALTAINNAIADCQSPSTTADCVLPLLPFITINETELANWTVTPAGTVPNVNNDIQVSDAYIIGGDASNPLRGIVNAVASSTNNNVANAVATIGLSNSGVTGEDIVDAAVDLDDKATLSDAQKFTVNRAGTVTNAVYFKTGFSGIAELAGISNISFDPSLLWSGTAGQLGSVGSGSCPGSLTKSGNSYSPSYACTVSLTTTPPVALTVTVKNYNQQILGSANTGRNVTGCTNPVATQCKVYKVNSITLKSTAVSGWTSAFSPVVAPNTSTFGIQAGTEIGIPNPPGFSSTTSSSPDPLIIGFTQDTTNSYTVAGTCGSCSATGKNCTYIPGTCAQ